MCRTIIRSVLLLALVVFPATEVQCQRQDPDSRTELWTEVGVYVPLDEKWRLYFLFTLNRAEETRKDDELTFGAHVDYTVNKRIALRSGYRYTFSRSDAEPFREHRIIAEQTFRQDLPWNLLLTDRNRQDFRFVNGSYSFRYRNRVMLEREFRLWGRSVTPYGSVEVYYDNRFNVWNRNRLTAGTQIQVKRGFPLLRELLPRKQIILDLYYTKQNDSRSQPHHVHALGASLALHF